MKTQVRNTRLKVTEENITKLAKNEIFVFGSNLAGVHGGGAALQAKNKFGAVLGIGEGLTGQCYALPTKDKNIETLSLNEIHNSIEVLLIFVKNNRDKMFKITAIGCGLAGYEAKDIAPMFESFICLDNISLPQTFINVIFPKVIKGYKVTDSEMKCRNLKFTLSEKIKIEGDIVICNNGLHFCKKLVNCFNYYDFNSNNRVFEVEGYGEFDYEQDKVCTREIKFLKELTWSEVLKLSNIGHSNTGHSNTGDSNTGCFNTGHGNTGCFNTDEPNARMFNKLCNKKMSEISIPHLYIPLTEWIYASDMTNEEKQNNSNFHVQNGYLKTNDYKVAWGIAWKEASQSKKLEFLDLPNFDAEIFEEITGIKIG